MPEEDYGRPAKKPLSPGVLLFVCVAIVAVSLLLAVYAFLGVSNPCSGASIPSAILDKSHDAAGWHFDIRGITRNDVPWDDVSIKLSDGLHTVTWSPKKTDLDSGNTTTLDYSAKTIGSLSVSLSITDRAGNGVVSGSDYFTLESMPDFASDVNYTALLIYEPGCDNSMTQVTFSG